MRVARWRSWGRWLIVTLLAVGGVSGAILKAFGADWPWLVAATAVVIAVMATPGKIFANRIESGEKRREERQQALRSGVLDSARLRVCDYTNPTELGVHRAIFAEVSKSKVHLPEFVPVYIPRDQDGNIVRQLTSGKFVLVLGDSGAGKTRLAFEAVQATVPAHRIIIPERQALSVAIDTMTEIGNAVLWLDDLENYLGTDGLTISMLSRVLSDSKHHRIVVATLRIQELDRLESEQNADPLLSEDWRKVLGRADIVRLDKKFTASEIQRARGLCYDPRIAEAIVHVGQYGLAEYVAAGPQLLQRWINGWSPRTHPRGAALVQAAIDCRRAGYLGPLPKSLLDNTHEHYLDTPGARLYPETLSDAWAWATMPWRHSTALLEEFHDGRVTVFDYLVDHIERSNNTESYIPESVVRTAIQHAGTYDLGRLADRARIQGHYALAYEGYNRALAHLTRANGDTHPTTLVCRGNLTLVLRDLGKRSEAIAEYQNLIPLMERALGADHPNTLSCRNNLALVLESLRKFDDAETEYRTILPLMEQALGAGHPNTLGCRNNLAMVLHRTGKTAEAAAELQGLVPELEKTLGVGHPDTLTCRYNLVSLLYEIGELDDRKAALSSILSAMESALVPEHLNMLAVRNDFADELYHAGKWEAAEAQYRLVLEGLERTLPHEFRRIVDARRMLALTLRELGRLSEAATEIRAVLLTMTEMPDVERSEILPSRVTLVTLLHDDGKLEEAANEFKTLLPMIDKEFGSEHWNTLAVRDRLIEVLIDLGRLDEAATETRNVLIVHERTHGIEHSKTLNIRINLAMMLRDIGRLDEAEAEFRRALDIFERTLGSGHLMTQTCRANLAGVLRSQGRVEEADVEDQIVQQGINRLMRRRGNSNPS